MRDFSYFRPEEDNPHEIESVIRQRRRKIARQQLVYTIILIFIISIICMWGYRKIVYAEFDGYIALDERNFRMSDDIFFLEANVRTGDLIIPGDTIFSYTFMHNFLDHTRIDYEPDIVSRNRDLRIQYEMTRQDLEVLRVRITELERQLAIEDHNIRFGLSSNHNKLRTEQELAETREQYKALRRKIGVLSNGLSQTNKSVLQLNNNGYGYVSIEDGHNYDLLDKLHLVNYVIAVDSAIVTKKYVPTSSVVLRGEPIVSLQSLRCRDNNLSIVGYVLPKQMKYVNYHSQAEIIVNDEISFTGRVMMLGARTEEIPGELRNTLSRDHTASIVVFDINPDQIIPFWALTNGVPVRIRINKLKNKGPLVGDYIIYNTTTGVYRETLMHARHECSEHPDSVYTLDGKWQAKGHTHDHAHAHDHTHAHNHIHNAAHDTAHNAAHNAPHNAPQNAQHNAAHNAPHNAPQNAQHNAPHNAPQKAPQKAPAAAPARPLTVGDSTGTYHIVVVSCADADGARRMVATLKQRGYKNARLMHSNDTNLIRVSIATFGTAAEANRALKKLKAYKEFESAWVLDEKKYKLTKK